MRIRHRLLCAATLALAAPAAAQTHGDLFRFQAGETRWASPENPTGGRGIGGRENKGGKGHAFETIAAGVSLSSQT